MTTYETASDLLCSMRVNNSIILVRRPRAMQGLWNYSDLGRKEHESLEVCLLGIISVPKAILVSGIRHRTPKMLCESTYTPGFGESQSLFVN